LPSSPGAVIAKLGTPLTRKGMLYFALFRISDKFSENRTALYCRESQWLSVNTEKAKRSSGEFFKHIFEPT
jgi:hypothetical protein